MIIRRHRITPLGLALLLVTVGCGEPMTATQDPTTLEPVEGSAPPVGEARESAEHTDFQGNYHEIFFSDDGESVLVFGRSEEELRLFRAASGTPLAWQDVPLPDEIALDVRVQITSLLATPGELLLTTREHGAWQHDAARGSWQPFAPELSAEGAQITRITSDAGRLVAHVVDALEPVGPAFPERRVQIWSLESEGWHLEHEALNMLIDYLPVGTKTLRSTMYGTVEVAPSQGSPWERVDAILVESNPRLTRWASGLGVVTQSGVWRGDIGAERWEKVSQRGAHSFARAGDALVLSDPNFALGILAPDGTYLALPALPTDKRRAAEVAASSDDVFATVYDGAVYRLTSDRRAWTIVVPGVDQIARRDFR